MGLGWRVKKLVSVAPEIIELARSEFRSPLRKYVRWQDRIECWRNGFLSQAFLLYDFSKYPRDQYLSDYRRYTSNRINGSYTNLLSNKIMFDAVMQRFPSHIPRTLGFIVNRRFQSLHSNHPVKDLESLLDWCVEGNSVVIKPHTGGGGSGIMVIDAEPSRLQINGDDITRDQLQERLKNVNLVIVQEKIQQAEYSQLIYPRSINTIRVLTVWDRDANTPFVAAAVHRFGANATGVVDNWTQGGLSASIDLASGELSPAAAPGERGVVTWHDSHPDSGARITGVVVPRWNEMLSKLLEVARHLPFLPYVGWDVVLDTTANLKIVEGNHRSGVTVLQIHKPLLQDSRVRKFFSHLS